MPFAPSRSREVRPLRSTARPGVFEPLGADLVVGAGEVARARGGLLLSGLLYRQAAVRSDGGGARRGGFLVGWCVLCAEALRLERGREGDELAGVCEEC